MNPPVYAPDLCHSVLWSSSSIINFDVFCIHKWHTNRLPKACAFSVVCLNITTSKWLDYILLPRPDAFEVISADGQSSIVLYCSGGEEDVANWCAVIRQRIRDLNNQLVRSSVLESFWKCELLQLHSETKRLKIEKNPCPCFPSRASLPYLTKPWGKTLYKLSSWFSCICKKKIYKV